MSRNQISKEWREILLNKLQERYGLTAKEAAEKTDAWLHWIQKQPTPRLPVLTAEVAEQHASSRNQSLVGSVKSRSRSVGHR